MDNPYSPKRKLKVAPKFTIYIDEKNEFRWRIVAGNNEIIGASSEGFSSRQASLNNLALLSEAIIQFNKGEAET